MNYDNILQAYKIIHTLPESENKQKLLEVIDYVDSCYINHCENLDREAIQEIEELPQETKNECVEVLKDILESCIIFEPKSILEQFKLKVNGNDR